MQLPITPQPKIRKFYDELEEILHKSGGEVFYVNLSCDLEEQKRRVVGEDRKVHKKITTVEEFEERMKKVEIFTATPSNRTTEIDTTNLNLDEIVKKIMLEFNLDEKKGELSNEKKPLGDINKDAFKLH